MGSMAPILIEWGRAGSSAGLRPGCSEETAVMKANRFAAAAAFLSISAGLAAAQTTLRIGLAEDPDILDPTLARTYVGRIVFASFCDKLFDIDEKLNVVP